MNVSISDCICVWLNTVLRHWEYSVARCLIDAQSIHWLVHFVTQGSAWIWKISHYALCPWNMHAHWHTHNLSGSSLGFHLAVVSSIMEHVWVFACAWRWHFEAKREFKKKKKEFHLRTFFSLFSLCQESERNTACLPSVLYLSVQPQPSQHGLSEDAPRCAQVKHHLRFTLTWDVIWFLINKVLHHA